MDGPMVVVPILGVMYMFAALAIVCDEFFVPALEEMVTALEISNDVAGATLMAAGGSAPELFTSMVGTFQGSSVGFGTIVGSAVFNVLFVIGMCAVNSKDVLKLTWWPLARDCSYYVLSLLVLAVFFDGVAPLPASMVKPGEPDSGIWWYEALILLTMYLGYVLLMKYNQKLYLWITRKSGKVQDSSLLEVKSDVNINGGEGEGLVDSKAVPGAAQRARAPTSFNRPTNFRGGVLSLMLSDKGLVDSAGLHIVSQIKGDVKESFQELDEDGSGFLDKEEVKHLMIRLGNKNSKPPTDAEIDVILVAMGETVTEDGRHEVYFPQFCDWYCSSEKRILDDMYKIFDEIDSDHSKSIELSEVTSLLERMTGRDVNMEEAQKARLELDENADGSVSRNEFAAWYQKSMFFEEHQKRNQEAHESTGMDLSWPKSLRGQILYVILVPLNFALVFTIPDVRKHGLEKYKYVAFFGSIAWVGIFSFLMVWWATMIGCIFGIPDAVMGLTFLAAGTSVPDLLTSVIVAKQGEGDMAVHTDSQLACDLIPEVIHPAGVHPEVNIPILGELLDRQQHLRRPHRAARPVARLQRVAVLQRQGAGGWRRRAHALLLADHPLHHGRHRHRHHRRQQLVPHQEPRVQHVRAVRSLRVPGRRPHVLVDPGVLLAL